MNGQDLFKVDRSADRLNESFFRMFGKKLNLENFDLEQLQDARNRLRTQISQIRSQSNFNETVENDNYLQAKMMLDAINAEIAERDEHIIEADIEEGQSDVDYELHLIAKSNDEEELIDAMEGLKGGELQIALEDMMEELKDELAEKGMTDVMRDEDKMIEMLMDKLFDEYGEDGEEYDYGDMNSSDADADADALKSAGFGSDEDYESIQYEDRVDEKAVSKAQQRAAGIALAAKRKGKTPPGKGAAAEMAKMSTKELEKYAGTKHKNLPAKKDESVTRGEDMTTLREGEVQQASAIVTAKTMVDRVGRWIEELSGMENETLLQLGDSIRDEMGQEQSRAFIEAVAPAIQSALETLKGTRDTLSGSVRSLASGEQPADMLGAEPAAGMDMEEPADMEMPTEEPTGDEFAAAEPAAGGAEEAGRQQRESIERQNKLLKVLAG